MAIFTHIKNISSKIFGRTEEHSKIDVWRVNINDIGDDIQDFVEILSPDEIARANIYNLSKDRRHFIISRAILRILLSSYIGQQPADITFSYTENLKPILNSRRKSPVCFNVSHSHELILYAISYGESVGIDVEYVRPTLDLDSDALAKRFFSSSEYEYLNLLPIEKRREEFIRIWVTKEAYLKAVAKGISDIERIKTIIPKDKSLILKLKEGNKDLDVWEIRQFEPEKGYIASIAYK